MAVSPLCERLKQYKMTTPPWKETFRKECMERLRNNRRRLIDGNRRALIGDIMEEEWTKLRDYHGDIDSYLMIYDEIRKEMDNEVEQVFEEYERSVNFPTASNQNGGQTIDMEKTNDRAAIRCAVCGTSNDYRTAAQVSDLGDVLVFCKCGHPRVDRRTKALESDLRWHEACDRLVTTAARHSEVCSATPYLQAIDQGMDDGNQLVVMCKVCGMQLVIW